MTFNLKKYSKKTTPPKSTKEHQKTQKTLRTPKKQTQSNTSLFDFTSVINQEYSYPERCRIIKLLWQAAFADYHIHHYEEHLIRRISDLIYVSHSDFIQAKLRDFFKENPKISLSLSYLHTLVKIEKSETL